MKIYRFILQTMAPFKWKLTFFVFVSIVWAIDLSLRPYLIKCSLDKIISENIYERQEVFFYYLSFYFLLMVFVFIVNTIYEYIWIKFLPQFRITVGNQVFNALLYQSYTFYQNNFAGDLGNKLANCMGAIPRIVKVLHEDFFRYSLAIAISAYTLWHIDFKFSLGLLVWVSIYMSSSIMIASFVRKRSITVAKESSRGMGYIIDILHNILSVKLFSHQESERQVVKNNFGTWRKLIQGRDLVLVNLYTFQTLTFIIFQALCVYWLVKNNKNGMSNAGDFILVFSISSSIYSCLLGIARTVADYSENLGTVSEALQVIYTTQIIPDKPGALDLQIKQGKIVFESVKFHYKGTPPLFQNLTVVIEAGKKVGLVGYSGGGKSTFVNLILRLYEITDGRILIDGQDICKITQASLRQTIAMIPQEPVLFHRSLIDNIRYGRIAATDEEVIEAAKLAGAHEFISKLPQGYESLVGERGVKLSGGQRQRIAIARAILKNAPILILDEATSQLDSITENKIQESLWKLMQHKTSIVIAHRLSTLLHMDRILVFDQGKIIEDGSHVALLAQRGLYKQLWEAQVGGFLPDKKKEDE